MAIPFLGQGRPGHYSEDETMGETRDENPRLYRAGGYAFPSPGHDDGGLTRFDFFAAAALTGLLMALGSSKPVDMDRLAGDAYEVADAMLRARSDRADG